MGMFDTVMVPCPRCDTPNEFQSKSGDCLLDAYTLENAPDDVLEGIRGDEELCRKCGTLFTVEITDTPPARPRRTLFAHAVIKPSLF
jgi:hypothetical protein